MQKVQAINTVQYRDLYLSGDIACLGRRGRSWSFAHGLAEPVLNGVKQEVPVFLRNI
jgi:hypothetical protein